jgi:hypothetical protein
MVRAALLVVALGAFFLLGCSGDDDGDTATSTVTASPASDVTATETATAAGPSPGDTATATPPSTGAGARTTGMPALDAVFDALESGDAARIRSLLDLQTLACTRDLGEGGAPKCGDTEAAGTMVEAFEFYTCAVDWRRDADLHGAIEELIAVRPLRFAAFAPPLDYLMGGDGTVLLLEGPDPRVGQPGIARGVAARVIGERITAIWLACGAGDAAATLLPSGAPEFLLAPP